MVLAEARSSSFEIPPGADFFAHCANRILEIRKDTHRNIPGHIYDVQTGLYDKEAQAIDKLLTACRGYMPPEDVTLVLNSYILALTAHADQYRDSGEPYSMHVTTVASYTVEKKLDARMIAACILHDTVEDTRDKPGLRITQETINDYISPDVAQIVQGLTAFRAEYGDKSIADEKTRLSIILSLLSDPRVAIIKIYDRLHNMETLQGKKKLSKRLEKITETQQIYIPLAKLLGMLDEAERLDYLCLRHDDRVDQSRLQSIVDARALFLQNFDAHNTLKELKSIAKVKHTLDWRVSSDAATYRDPASEHHVNINISVSKVSSADGVKGAEKLWNVMRRFIHHTDSFTVEGLPHENEFYKDMQDGLSDSLHFWVVRVNDGTRFHMHIYPTDVFHIELTSITAAYQQKAISTADRELYMLADYKRQLLAERLSEVLRDMGGVNMVPRYLMRSLEWRLPANMMYVIGLNRTDDGEVQKPWRMKRGSTVLDYAYAIAYSGAWTKIESVEVNGEEKSLSYILQPKDVVHIHFADTSTVTPAWIHIFTTEPDGPKDVESRLIKALRSSPKEESELFTDIRREGLVQCQKYLPAGDPVFRYGLLESAARLLVEEAVEDIQVYMEENHLHGLLTTLQQQPKDTQLQKLFYFGVGLGIVNKDMIDTVMNLAGEANRQVRMVEIEFRENIEGQMSAVGDITKKLGINLLGAQVVADAGGLRVIMYISPQDRSKIQDLSGEVWANERLRELTFSSIHANF